MVLGQTGIQLLEVRVAEVRCFFFSHEYYSVENMTGLSLVLVPIKTQLPLRQRTHVSPAVLQSVFRRRHQILKSKTKETPKFLSSSGITEVLNLYLFTTFSSISSYVWNQRILNFRVVAPGV